MENYLAGRKKHIWVGLGLGLGLGLGQPIVSGAYCLIRYDPLTYGLMTFGPNNLSPYGPMTYDL